MKRVPVNTDLGGPQPLQQVARPVDTYYQPQMPNVPKPIQNTQLAQLADALQSFQPALKSLGTAAAQAAANKELEDKDQAKSLAARLATLSNNSSLTDLTKHLSTQEQQTYRGVLQSSYFKGYYQSNVAENLFNNGYSNLMSSYEKDAQGLTDINAPLKRFNDFVAEYEQDLNAKEIPIASRYKVYTGLDEKRAAFVTHFQKQVGKNQYDNSKDQFQQLLTASHKTFATALTKEKDPLKQAEMFTAYQNDIREKAKNAVEFNKMLGSDVSEGVATSALGFAYSFGNINPDDPVDNTRDIKGAIRFLDKIQNLEGADGPVFFGKQGQKLAEARQFLGQTLANEATRSYTVNRRNMDAKDDGIYSQGLDVGRQAMSQNRLINEHERNQILDYAGQITDPAKKKLLMDLVKTDDKDSQEYASGQLLVDVRNGKPISESVHTNKAGLKGVIQAMDYQDTQNEKQQNKQVKRHLDRVRGLSSSFDSSSATSPGLIKNVLFPIKASASASRKLQWSKVMAGVLNEWNQHIEGLEDQPNLTDKQIEESLYTKAYQLGRKFGAKPDNLQTFVELAGRDGVKLGNQQPSKPANDLRAQFMKNQQMIQQLQQQLQKTKGGH